MWRGKKGYQRNSSSSTFQKNIVNYISMSHRSCLRQDVANLDEEIRNLFFASNFQGQLMNKRYGRRFAVLQTVVFIQFFYCPLRTELWIHSQQQGNRRSSHKIQDSILYTFVLLYIYIYVCLSTANVSSIKQVPPRYLQGGGFISCFGTDFDVCAQVASRRKNSRNSICVRASRAQRATANAASCTGGEWVRDSD